MITPAWIQEKITVAETGTGIAHVARDFGGIYERSGELSCQIEVLAQAAGALAVNFASVTKPAALLSVGANDATVAQTDFYTAEQLATCAEQYVLNVPGPGVRYVFVVTNFRSQGRYLHTWFDNDGSTGGAEVSVIISAKGRA